MDYIESLPTDNEPIDSEERQLMDKILEKDAPAFQRLIQELKLPIVAGLLFMIVNNPQITEFFKTSVPYTRTSEMSMLCFKTLLFTVALFLYININHLLK